MITSETPYKLSEIIRDTWPNVYRKPQTLYNKTSYYKDKDGKPN